jgi:hypothetical protein
MGGRVELGIAGRASIWINSHYRKPSLLLKVCVCLPRAEGFCDDRAGPLFFGAPVRMSEFT